MKTRFMQTVLLCLITLCVTTGFAHAATPKGITILCGPSGGTMEVVGAAAAEIWKNNIPGVEFSAVPSGGSSVNVPLMEQGDGQVVFLTGDSTAAALDGVSPFKKKYPELRALVALYPNTMQIWALGNKNIKDFSDLVNKKFTYGQPGGGAFQPALNLMDVYGFSPKEVRAKGGKILPYAWGEAVNALGDGNIDAVFWTTSFPAARIVDAQIGNGSITLLQLPADKLNTFKQKYKGWVDVRIPAGTYKNQDAEVLTIGTPVMLACLASLPDDLVYTMMKTLWENKAVLGNTHALLKGLSEDNVAMGMVAPLHPGAKRFYQEKNIRIEE